MSFFDEIEEMRKRVLLNLYRALREADEMIASMMGGPRLESREFEELLESRLREFRESVLEPMVGFYDEGDRIRIVVDLPGVKRDSIDIIVLEDRLEISAKVEEKTVRRALGSLSERFSFREYRGVYTLPTRVDPSTARVATRGSTVVIEVRKKV